MKIPIIKFKKRDKPRLYDENFAKAWKELKANIAEPILPFLEKICFCLQRLISKCQNKRKRRLIMDEAKEKEVVKKIRDAENALNQALSEAAKAGIEVLDIEQITTTAMGDKANRIQIYIKLAKIL